MKVKALIKYLQAVAEEAGDIPIVIGESKAHSHELENVEVEDRVRYWEGKYLKRAKAVVLR